MTEQSTIRQLPAQNPRVETGPVRFGDDWAGVFIRGDAAAYMRMCLDMALNHGDTGLFLGMSQSIIKTLNSCDERGASNSDAVADPGKDALLAAVARAINPYPFDAWQGMYDHVLPSEGEEKARLYADMTHKEDCDKALKQAAAAIATMFERLRTPSEGMIKFAEQRIYETSDTTRMFAHGRAHAAFQIVAEAFQQDNSDATS